MMIILVIAMEIILETTAMNVKKIILELIAWVSWFFPSSLCFSQKVLQQIIDNLIFLEFCEAAVTCNGQGTCNTNDGSCQCNDDFIGEACDSKHDLIFNW